MRKRWQRVMAVALLVCASAAASCSQPTGSDDPDGLVGWAVSSAPLVPEDSGFVSILAVDGVRVRSLLAASDEAVRADYLHTDGPTNDGGLGASMPPLLLLGQLGLDNEELIDAIGFGRPDIDRIVETGPVDTPFTAIEGPSAWGGLVEPMGDDLFTIGDGEDFEVDTSERGFETLGRPVRFAEEGGMLFSSLSTALIEAWRDGSGDRASTDPRFVDLAEQLDAENAYAAIVMAGLEFRPDALADTYANQSGDTGEVPIAPAMIEREIEAVGIGYDLVDEQPVEIVVYHFGTDDAADAAADSVRDAWTSAEIVRSIPGGSVSDFVEVQSVDVRGATVVVIAAVREGEVGRATDWAWSRESMFSHE